MNSGEVGENQESADTHVSPGRILKEARDKKGLSQTEVAQRLRLETRLIDALEADDEDNLPAPIYVTGYLRAYARLLGLDEEQLISGFYQSDDSTVTLLPENVDYGTARRSTISLSLILVFILVLGGIALAWWWPIQAPVSEVLPVLKSAQPPRPDRTDPVAALATEPSPVIQAKPVGPAKEATAAAEAGAGYIEPMYIADESADPLPEPPDPAIKAAAAAPLRVEYRGDSWTEIRDANGEKLVFRLVTEGSRLELRGQPPFSVLLGYAPAVSITYNGRPFDVGAVSKNDTARFVIGSPSDSVVP